MSSIFSFILSHKYIPNRHRLLEADTLDQAHIHPHEHSLTHKDVCMHVCVCVHACMYTCVSAWTCLVSLCL